MMKIKTSKPINIILYGEICFAPNISTVVDIFVYNDTDELQPIFYTVVFHVVCDDAEKEIQLKHIFCAAVAIA